MAECIFCNIIARSMSAELLAENESAIAILDINPIHYGHVLIIPKKHSRDFLEVSIKDLNGMMNLTQMMAKALVSAFRLEGFNFFSNNGRIAGQSIFHFHIHVTPRYPNDEIHFNLQLKQYGSGQMRDVAQKIKEHIHI